MGKRFGSLLVLATVVMFVFCFHGEALAKKRLKEYDTIVVGSVIVKPDAGIPKAYADNLKDALVRQLQRYNSSYGWAKKITTTMPSSKAGVVVMEAQINSYAPPTAGRRIGKSFIPGGEWMGSASVQFSCKFLDGQKGTVVLTQDVNAKSSGTDDTIAYALERGAEYMAKVVHKNR